MLGKKWVIRIGLIVVLAGIGAYKYYLWQRPLVPRLVSNDDNARNMALTELVKLEPQKRKETAQALLQFQNDPDARVRRSALYALRQLGETTPDALGFCVKSLGDPDRPVRDEALAALSRFGEAAIPTLVNALTTEDKETLNGTTRILANLEARAVPSLVVYLKNSSSQAPGRAIGVLKRIGKPAKEATPVLRGFLNAKDPGLRLEAAEALDVLEALPKTATPILARDILSAKESYKDANAPRPRLAKLLEKVDPRRRTTVDLGFDLKQKNPVIRYRAAYVISETNPPNVGALEILVDALEDPDVTVAARAMVALARMGLDKTERLKKVAAPRMRSAIRRSQAAVIEGFDDIVQPALAKVGR